MSEEIIELPQPTAPAQPQRETCREFLARLRDPLRWQSALYDLLIWFMVGIILTTMLSRTSPGYPIIVGTPSIDIGVYWLDRTPLGYYRGETVTFQFMRGDPAQAWLEERYGQKDPVHTKIVRGISGDTVHADAQGRLTVCTPSFNGEPPECVIAGAPKAADSKGRPMKAWLAASSSYTIKDGELWVYGTDANSLDSRYHGPIPRDSVHGRAKPLFLWGHATPDPMAAQAPISSASAAKH